MDPAAQDQAFARFERKADLSNFHFLRYRGVDGFLVTAKNSGTHWLRFMLSAALAEQFGRPPPLRSSGPDSDDYIGHPRRRPRWPEPPRIGSSHNLPSRILNARAVRAVLPLPPTVVLVRDLKEALLSFYVKWREVYGVSLAEFAHGDPGGRRYRADVWWYVSFFNRWGEAGERFPERTLIVRFEDVRADPSWAVRRVAAFWGVDLTEAAVAAGVEAGRRDRMQARLDPLKSDVISDPHARGAFRFSAEDHAVIDAILARHLRHDFGYGLSRVRRAQEDAA